MQRLFSSLIFEEGKNHDLSVCEDGQTQAIAEALSVPISGIGQGLFRSLPADVRAFFLSLILQATGILKREA